MIKQAAGISKGGGYTSYEWVGAINMKQVKYTPIIYPLCFLSLHWTSHNQVHFQVYHIAKNKQENDPRLKNVPLDQMCRNVIKQAEQMSVAVIRDWVNCVKLS